MGPGLPLLLGRYLRLGRCRGLCSTDRCARCAAVVRSQSVSRCNWRRNGNYGGIVLLLLLFSDVKIHCYPPFAERIGEVFILLYVFLFVFLFGQWFPSNPRADSRQILRAGVAWVGTCLLPFWGSATPGGKRGNDIRVVSFVNRTATIFVYLSVTKCGRICRAHTCTHSRVEP